ncbi:MAG: riboflavin biosynthesis protein RibF [Ruminococcaceae bacterium]|nr:riboflavin biosynthesis protein RibF [Oscillospiraceae bacterium]
MEIFESVYDKSKFNNCVLAFGNFDGVHKGHQHLLNSAKRYAKEKGLTFGVYTFSDSPKFANADHSVLSLLGYRLSYINEFCNPDFVYLEHFDDVKNMNPEMFVRYIVDKFGCVCAFCGENFSFGKEALGKSADLVRLMQESGKDAVIVESLKCGGVVVSSTYIRSLLADGRADEAWELLGAPYGFTSKVVHGAHLGHKLGFPTINQIIPKELVLPRFGVYSTIVIVDGKEYMGVTNFGVKPTVSSDNTPVAETYVIDFDGDVYGKQVGLYFCKKLRDERKFSSLDELKENISINVEQTKKFFEEKNGN